MKKLIYILVVMCTLTGCMGLNTTSYTNDPVSTSVNLSEGNFKIVRQVSGEVSAKYILGFGGSRSQKNLKSNAVAEMYKNADLRGSQAIANITVATSQKRVLGALVVVRTAVAYGYVVEFDGPSTTQMLRASLTAGGPIVRSSCATPKQETKPIESQNQVTTDVAEEASADQREEEKTVQEKAEKERVEAEQVEQERIAKEKSEQDYYYIAWVLRSGNLVSSYYDEIKESFNMQKVSSLMVKESTSSLLEKSARHDEVLNKYSSK